MSTPKLKFEEAQEQVEKCVEEVENTEVSATWEKYEEDLADFISYLDDARVQLREEHGCDHAFFSAHILHMCATGVLAMSKFGVAFRGRDPGDPGSIHLPVDGKPIDRKIVWAALAGERAYQDNLPESRCLGKSGKGGNTIADNPLSFGATLTMLRHYGRQLDEMWTTKAGNEAALHPLRKVTSVCLRHVETYGARETYDGE